MNIATVHSKGGVSKSTIAANLGVWLHHKNIQVVCVDLDGGKYANRTLTTTIAQAEPTLPLFHAETAAEVKTLLPKLAQRFQFVVADAPGGFQRTAETNLELLKHTDFALIPVKPHFGDIEPLAVVNDVVQKARLINPLLEARVIVNCVDGRTKTGRNLNGAISDIQSIAPHLKVMHQTIRVDTGAFETAAKSGTVVVKGPRSTGREDLDALFSELLSDMIVSISDQERRVALKKHTMDGKHGKKAING